MESLARKAREGVFARMLDDQVPPGIRIIECGCGTAQLSNFLSAANREVFATDICVNSLRMGKRFADEQGAGRVHFAGVRGVLGERRRQDHLHGTSAVSIE